jgi:hypothetical protein
MTTPMTTHAAAFLARALFFTTLFGAPSLLAQTPPPTSSPEPSPPAAPGPPPPTPTAGEIKRVNDYYLRGAAQGPVLVESVLCKKTDKVDGKLSCVEKLPERIKKGDIIIAFVRFFVPKGGKYDDVKVKFLLDGELRSTSDFTLSEAWTGYSNYKQTTAQKVGKWEIQVLRGENVLASHVVMVE